MNGHSDSARPTHDDLVALAGRLPELIRFGTSSWNYPGWQGLIYSRKYPAKGAGAAMLAEYARWPLARTVGIDAFLYAPPAPKALMAYAAALPPGFSCVTKVWDRITAHTFTSPKETRRKGEINPDWLNADLFIREVLNPMQAYFAGHIGPFVFEFQAMARSSGVTAAGFAARLDTFFGALPVDVPYAVEIRNEEFLVPPYFAVLRNHGVAHVFNSWTRMPAMGEQLLMHDSVTANLLVARALLRPGRTFAQAVDAFAPYDRIREENLALRSDLVALARTALDLRIPAYLVVGNRAEGCSPLTIAAVVRWLLESPVT